MYQDVDIFNEPIVAFACEDNSGNMHFIHCQDAIKFKDIDFQDDLFRVGDFYVIYDWFKTVIICTKEILEDLKQKL